LASATSAASATRAQRRIVFNAGDDLLLLALVATVLYLARARHRGLRLLLQQGKSRPELVPGDIATDDEQHTEDEEAHRGG
jgi:hypothetical protein